MEGLQSGYAVGILFGACPQDALESDSHNEPSRIIACDKSDFWWCACYPIVRAVPRPLLWPMFPR